MNVDKFVTTTEGERKTPPDLLAEEQVKFIELTKPQNAGSHLS